MDEKELRPVRDRKVLIILMVIFVVIAVSVLYVYQAGDRKTVLGNQPIPAGQVNVGPAPVAFHVPVVGVPSSPATGGGAESQSTVNCPVCSTKGLPICSSCGSIMQPIGQGGAGGLFACPRCGAAGLPICPRCGGHMASAGHAGKQLMDNIGGGGGGQFQCPVCGATGLPRWGPGGAPICPSCGARMRIR